MMDTDSACYKTDKVYPYEHSNDHSNHKYVVKSYPGLAWEFAKVLFSTLRVVSGCNRIIPLSASYLTDEW